MADTFERPLPAGLTSEISFYLSRIIGGRIGRDTTHSGMEFATVDHVSGTIAYVVRAGQTTAIPIDIVGGLALIPGDTVIIERPYGSLNTAIIRTKV